MGLLDLALRALASAGAPPTLREITTLRLRRLVAPGEDLELEVKAFDPDGHVRFEALRAGEIDAYVEYTGTIWATLMKRDGAAPPRHEVLAEVEGWLAARGIVLAAALGFENTYVLGMRGADARARGVRSIADLARQSSELAIGGDFEFFARAEWAALERSYGLAFRARRTMDPSLMYQALAAGEE